jgi:hypothetical protein
MTGDPRRACRVPSAAGPRDAHRRELLRLGLTAGAGARVMLALGAWGFDAAALAQAPTAPAMPEEGLTPFSRFPPASALPAPWREQTLSGIRPNRVSLVRDEGRTVLQFDSDASASSVLHPVGVAQAQATRLRWRWKTSGYPQDRWFGEKRGDDFAARVYVLYDYPLNRVPLPQRLMLGMARSLHDPELPAATMCYLLDPRAAQDTLIESPYTSRVRMIVVRSTRTTDRWWDEERDLTADFTRAFGAEYGAGAAPIRAVVVAADTDQTGTRLVTRFGDVSLETR